MNGKSTLVIDVQGPLYEFSQRASLFVKSSGTKFPWAIGGSV